MGRETRLVESLPPPRIWNNEADGSDGAMGEPELDGGGSVVVRGESLEVLLRPEGGEDDSRSNLERSNFLFLGSIAGGQPGQRAVSLMEATAEGFNTSADRDPGSRIVER